MTSDKKALWLTVPAWGHTIPAKRFMEQLNEYGIEHAVFSSGVWSEYFQDISNENFDYNDFYSEQIEINQITQYSGIKTLINAFDLFTTIGLELRSDKSLVTTFNQFDFIFCDAVALPLAKLIKQSHQKIIVYQTSIQVSVSSAKSIISTYKNTPVGGHIKSLATDTVVSLPRIIYLLTKFNLKSQTRMRLIEILDPKGDATVVLTSNFFQPFTNQVSETYFIGPLFDTKSVLSMVKKTAYVSLGTMKVSELAVLQPVVESLIANSYKIKIKIPKNYQADWLEHQNISKQPFFNQIAELENASLFITHAGKNSCDEAILTQTPTICIPQANDQFILSARMQELGLGEIWLPDQGKSFENVLTKLESEREFYGKNLKSAYHEHINCSLCESEFGRLTQDLGLDSISRANKQRKQ